MGSCQQGTKELGGQMAWTLVEPSMDRPGYSQPPNGLQWWMPHTGPLDHTASIR